MPEQTVTLDPAQVAQEMLADVPTPESSSAPTQENTTPPRATETPSSAADERDSLNRPYDPEKFRPEKDSLGRWKNLRGGRKKKIEQAAAFSSAPVPPADSAWSEAERDDAAKSGQPDGSAAESSEAPRVATPAPDVVDRADDAAEVVCRAVYTGAGVVFDAPEDCEPKPAEHENMKKAVAAYIRAKGWAFGAGVGIALVFAAYMLRTLRKPEPSKTFRGWFADMRARRAKPVAHVKTDEQTPHDPASGVVTITPSLDGVSERSAV